jgi:site-specific DNA-adenine methylase
VASKWCKVGQKSGDRGCLPHQATTYGGQRTSAPQISRFIPKAVTYVEPFAGHAYNWQHEKKKGKFEKAVLGDKNCAALKWIKQNRTVDTNTKLKCQDWKATVRQTDSKSTVTLFDPPWDDPKKCYKAYKGNCQQLMPEIVKMAAKMKGTVILLDRDGPEKRKVICRAPSPFKCHFISVNGTGYMKKDKPWKEIVGVKK